MPSLRYCMSNNFYTWMLCQLWTYKNHIARQQFCINSMTSKKLHLIFEIGASMYSTLFSNVIHITVISISVIMHLDNSISHDISIKCILHNGIPVPKYCNVILILDIQK